MRMAMGLGSVATWVVVLVGMTGCSSDDYSGLSATEPRATTLFASDEEALVAAEEAYGKYLAASDQVAERGGLDTELYDDVATAEMRLQLNESAEKFFESGWHASGSSTFDSMSIQQVTNGDGGVTTVTVLVCIDVTNVRVLDAKNSDVTPSGRDDRLPLEVEFQAVDDDNLKLLLSRSDIWLGNEFCGP